MSLTQVPGRQQTSLWDGSGWHIGLSVPLRRELPTTITLLFFFTGAVIMRSLKTMLRLLSIFNRKQVCPTKLNENCNQVS